MNKKVKKRIVRILRALLTLVLSAASLFCMVQGFAWGATHVGVPGNTSQAASQQLGAMDRFDMLTTNQLSAALEGVLSIEKVYWLKDEDLIAPEPDPDKFGTTPDPAAMAGFLEAAQELLEGQKTLFQTDMQLHEGSEVTYYLDETIMVITWKMLIHNCVYTISEVKIAHPSQFRRFLADGEYGSDKQYLTTQMAQTVNAVTASSGDFYKFRYAGVSVYNGEVMRANKDLDVCYITEDGDMLFTRKGEITTQEQAQSFVDENKVRFSLAFGPVMVDNYQKVTPSVYPVGETNDKYSRAALAMMDDLHYLLIAANHGPYGIGVPNIHEFADTLVTFGVKKAYALDGGQTAAIVTNDQLISRPDYGAQRLISDIIYFATAVPDGG